MSSTPQKDPFTFTPIHPFDMEQPRSWAATIGQLNWDKWVACADRTDASEKIVFSKRSLLEFLKSCQVTVNTNNTEIAKLPKYATFGRFSKAATDAAVADLVEAEIADPSHGDEEQSNGNGVRPTRKVVDPPGGKQSLKVYGDEYEETDALSAAPCPSGDGVDVDIDRMQHLKLHVEPEVDGGATITEVEDKAKADKAEAKDDRVTNPPPNFRPTRKVHQAPGGATQIGAAFFGGYEDETAEDREAARAPTGGKKPAGQQSSGSLW